MLIDSEPHVAELIAYQRKVLDALGIRNGPTHGEVKWCRGSPVLMEVGARCHGGEGAWKEICEFIYGSSQIALTINAYLFPELFAVAPDAPHQRRGYGRLIFVVSKVEGILKEVNHHYLEEIDRMSSKLSVEIFHQLIPGYHIRKTVDCFTWAGIIKLINTDEEQLDRDYNRIREMEDNGLFIVE